MDCRTGLRHVAEAVGRACLLLVQLRRGLVPHLVQDAGALLIASPPDLARAARPGGPVVGGTRRGAELGRAEACARLIRRQCCRGSDGEAFWSKPVPKVLSLPDRLPALVPRLPD